MDSVTRFLMEMVVPGRSPGRSPGRQKGQLFPGAWGDLEGPGGSWRDLTWRDLEAVPGKSYPFWRPGDRPGDRPGTTISIRNRVTESIFRALVPRVPKRD